MAQSVVVRVREQSRGSIGALVIAWSIVQSISWLGILRDLALTPRWWHLWLASNLLLGVIIGVRRRMGTVFLAPVVAALINFVPTIVGLQLTTDHGVLWGFSAAMLFYALFGWLVYGTVQVTVLFAGAVVGRMLMAPFRHRSGVVIIGPDGQIT